MADWEWSLKGLSSVTLHVTALASGGNCMFEHIATLKHSYFHFSRSLHD